MHIAYIVFAVITIMINAAIAIADYCKAPFVLANSAEVNVPRAWLPALATCKALGALGLLVALLVDAPILAALASTGLVLFFIGAIVFHIRAHVYYNIAFPGLYLFLAAATLVTVTTQLT